MAMHGNHVKYCKKEKMHQPENMERLSIQTHDREGTQAWVRAFDESVRYV
jgi:hypothetical protein